MAMVNPTVLNLANAATVKDSRWLTLEVCREFQRNKCTRSDQECKFAHPPPHVEVQNGRVTACFDSIKGKCQRKEPPCKYLHPPQHLREQLLQNGRNNLILKNLQLQAAQQAAISQAQGMVPAGLIPISNNIAYSSTMPSYPRSRPEMFEAGTNKMTLAFPNAVFPTGQYPPLLAHPYLSGAPTPTSAVAFNPYGICATGMPTIAVPQTQTNGESPSMISQHPAGIIPTQLQQNTQQTKLTRPDRLESQIPGMIGQYKRYAVADAKGLPMYQPISNVASYQQAIAAMQLQQPHYIPVSLAGHPPNMQRF